MNTLIKSALALIAAGGLALAYAGISSAMPTRQAEARPIRIAAGDESPIDMVLFAGIGAMVIGGLMFATELSS